MNSREQEHEQDREQEATRSYCASWGPLSKWPALWLTLLLTVAGTASLVIGVTGFFRLGRDARCLRNSLTQAGEPASVNWDKKIELSVGPLSCSMLRAGLSFVHLDPDARQALRVVRGAEVGVYQSQSRFPGVSPSRALASADRAMADRGWQRLVGVVKEHEWVLVYVPNDMKSTANVRACVAIMEPRQLVIVAARSNVDPLLALALRHAEEKEPNWWPVRL
jgi:hypothetical protein